MYKLGIFQNKIVLAIVTATPVYLNFCSKIDPAKQALLHN